MEMIPKNSDWHEREEVRKGDKGEAIIHGILNSKGYRCYKCEDEGPHLIDFIVQSADKTRLFLAEVKTKPRRKKYPDTGFNLKHYQEYKKMSEDLNLRVFVFFVDKDMKQIYGNYLDELDKPRIVNGREYPINWRGKPDIRYYPLKAMKRISSISEEDVRELEREEVNI